MPLISPAPSSVMAAGTVRPAASVYAVSMLFMAVVRLEGVGTAKLDAYTFPITWVDVENTFVESAINPNPVMNDAAAGLTPIFPVTAEAGTVETADFPRITKLPAAPRSTGAGPTPTGGVAAATVSVVFPVLTPDVAVITDVPATTPVARPLALMVATPVVPDDQITCVVISAEVLSE